MRLPIALCLALVLPWMETGVATAQSLRFLHADRWELPVGTNFQVSFPSLQDGELKARPWPERFDWFFVRTGGGQVNMDDPRVAPGRREMDVHLGHAGITMIAADRTSYVERVPASTLGLFLAQRLGKGTLPGPLESLFAKDRVRVRRTESYKALVRTLGKEGFLPNSATAQSKTGQTVEIRPLADPTSVPVKSDLPLRIYLPNPKKAGTLVTARHLATGRTQTFATDRMGTGFFTVTVAGLWVVEAHHARRAPEGDEHADWELFSATLSFEVPPGDPRQGGVK